MSYLTIHEIFKEYGDIVELLEESEGELTPELEERLAINRNDLQEKVERFRSIMDAFNGESDRLKMMANNITAKAKSYSNAAERVKSLVELAVLTMGTAKLSKEGNKSYFVPLTTGGKATAINYPKLQIEDTNKVPEDFKEHVLTILTNKEGIEVLRNYLDVVSDVVVEDSKVDEMVKTAELVKHLKSLPLKGTEYAKLQDNYKVRFT